MHTRTCLSLHSQCSPPPLSPRRSTPGWVPNPNGEGLYRFTVDPQTGALAIKRW
jgi:hypothetical protein